MEFQDPWVLSEVKIEIDVAEDVSLGCGTLNTAWDCSTSELTGRKRDESNALVCAAKSPINTDGDMKSVIVTATNSPEMRQPCLALCTTPENIKSEPVTDTDSLTLKRIRCKPESDSYILTCIKQETQIVTDTENLKHIITGGITEAETARPIQSEAVTDTDPLKNLIKQDPVTVTELQRSVSSDPVGISMIDTEFSQLHPRSHPLPVALSDIKLEPVSNIDAVVFPSHEEATQSESLVPSENLPSEPPQIKHKPAACEFQEVDDSEKVSSSSETPTTQSVPVGEMQSMPCIHSQQRLTPEAAEPELVEKTAQTKPSTPTDLEHESFSEQAAGKQQTQNFTFTPPRPDVVHQSQISSTHSEKAGDITGLTCDVCRKTFARAIHLERHKVSVHKVHKCLVSGMCSKAFSENEQFKRHTRISKKKKSHVCYVCSRVFTEASSLEKHKLSHANRKPLRSSVHNKVFSSHDHLKTPARAHKEHRSFICDVCGKAFNQSSHLYKHMRTHTRCKPFTCDMCNKTFTQEGSLMKHIRIHAGNKPYTCKVCSKAFTQSNHLKDHMKLHTGQKPFVCDVCRKAFTRAFSLKEHMNTHTSQSSRKPFTCDTCGKTFTRAHSVKKHIRHHTGEKPYPCGVCNKAFAHKYTLKMHVETCRPQTGK